MESAKAECAAQCTSGEDFVCTSINTFKTCISGKLSNIPFSCPGELVCSTTDPDWCVDSNKNPTAVIDCENTCNGDCPDPGATLEFQHICLGTNTYRLCSSIFPIDRICPDGQICTAGNKCVSEIGNVPTCNNGTATTTTSKTADSAVTDTNPPTTNTTTETTDSPL